MDVVVHRWLNSNTKKTYYFSKDGNGNGNGNGNKIDICIFKDDTIIKAINKIAVGIHNLDSSVSLASVPFIWWKNKNLRFDLDFIIKNPFSDNIKLDKTNANIVYKNYDLFDIQEVNIVFLSDLTNENVNKNNINILFPDRKDKWNYDNYKVMKDESNNLYNIWLRGKQDTYDIFTIRRINLIANIKLSVTNNSIIDIFNNNKCNSKLQFMQLIQDSSHILYKTYKDHNIPLHKFKDWTMYNNIPKSQIGISLLNAMFHFKEDIFGHVMLDSNGQIYVRFKYETSNTSNWEEIKTFCDTYIEKWLTTVLQAPVKLKEESYFLKTIIPVSLSIANKDYGKLLSKENLVFNLVSADKDILNIDYLRSKTHNKTEIIDYIRSRAKLGISLRDIRQELIEKQLTDADINLWIEQYISEIQAIEQQIVNPEAPKQRKKKTISLGCTLKVQTKKYEIIVTLDNVSSMDEAYSICRWIRGTVYTYVDKMSQVPKKQNEPVLHSESPVVPKPKKVSDSSSSSNNGKKANPNADADAEEREFDIDLSDGGAGGKELHGFLIKALKKADPKIFDGPDNYSEQCQANNFRQPVVITKDEKANIDKLDYTSSADDYVEYGSDPKNKNYYTCPRIWCPISKIPLTIEQLNKLNGRCPAPHNEEPIHMYKDNYWRKSADTPHHVGFLANINSDKLCMPCCGKKILKDDKLKQCTIYANGENPEDKGKPPEDKGKPPEDKGKPPEDKGKPPEPSDTKPKRGRKKSVKDSEDEKKSKQETYIFDKQGILDANRYGLIPQDLHTFLYPNTPYSDCSKSISTTECVVRKGQGHVKDFLLESIAHASGFNSKINLIKHIVEILDPINYISLDNGHIFTAFMDDPIQFSHSNKTEIYNEWIAYYNSNTKYSKMLNITLGNRGNKDNMYKNLENIKIMRQLIIFKSLKNFIKYLRSDSNKNPQHFYDLMHRMGILLAIWHRNSGTSASLVCPGYTNLNELIYVSKKHEKVAMILEDTSDYFYEPLEMKVRSKEGVSLFPVSGKIGSSVKNLLLNSCKLKTTDDAPIIENIFVEMIRSLEVWTELQLAPRASPFLFKTVLLRADGKVYGFLTNNNLLVTCPNENINIVPLLFKTCKILKHITYIEDIPNERLEITFMARDDFILYISKIKSYGLGLDSGNITQVIDDLINGPVGLRGNINMPLVPHGLVIPLVPIISENDELHKYNATNNKSNAKWFQLQNAVAKELLKNYETLVVPLLKENKKTRINTLLRMWHKLPESSMTKVQVILEELPLDSKTELIKYINNIGIDERVRIYYATHVFETSKQRDWLFSQAAVEEGLPYNVYISNKQFVPNDYNATISKQISEAVLSKHVHEKDAKYTSNGKSYIIDLNAISQCTI